ncbi:MAG TPA: helix-turn-helix domain-containing protein, partial [Pirellulales bacterium]|nr:helix-turn-helix domain-containing protein [Pirellulales bacterium]
VADDSPPLVPLACSLLTAELLQTTIRALVRAAAKNKPRPTLLLANVDLLGSETRAELLGFLRLADLPVRMLSTARQSLAELPGDRATAAALDACLATITIEIPPLADRLEDLPLLAQMLLEQRNANSDKQLAGFTPEALERLAHHAWPGQLGELAEAVAHAHAHAASAWVTVDDLPPRLFLAASAARNPRLRDETIVLDQFLAEIERELIVRALSRARGNKTRAAKLLGMTRPRLYRRLVQLGLIADDELSGADADLDTEPVAEFIPDDELE